jgi:hypothetical protein
MSTPERNTRRTPRRPFFVAIAGKTAAQPGSPIPKNFEK